MKLRDSEKEKSIISSNKGFNMKLIELYDSKSKDNKHR